MRPGDMETDRRQGGGEEREKRNVGVQSCVTFMKVRAIAWHKGWGMGHVNKWRKTCPVHALEPQTGENWVTSRKVDTAPVHSSSNNGPPCAITAVWHVERLVFEVKGTLNSPAREPPVVNM